MAFLREAKIPTFPMLPFLEGSTPTDLEREDRGRTREGEEPEDETDKKRAEAAAHAVQQGDKWHHTYFYLTNIDEKERERLMTL